MNKFTVSLLSICFFLFSSCGSKNPENVRELMESEGWIFCKTVLTDSYVQFTGCEPFIHEDAGTFDLFMKENGDFRQFALTIPNSNNRSLEYYYKDGDTEHLKANCWINYLVEEGDYTLRADHARSGSGHLGVITKRYNGKAIIQNSSSQIYLNIGSHSAHQHSASDHENSQETGSDISEDTQSDEEPEPMQKMKQCPVCYGLGSCGGCGGSGSVYNSIDYSPGQYVDCGACGGSGRCGACDGSGMVEDFGW